MSESFFAHRPNLPRMIFDLVFVIARRLALDVFRSILPAGIPHIYSIVPSEDQHSSEYLADCDARRAYISGFTGSAGLAIISLTGKSNLFTDGRYFLQATNQLDG